MLNRRQLIGGWAGSEPEVGAQKGTDGDCLAYPLPRCLARKWTTSDFYEPSTGKASEGRGKACVNSGSNREYSQGRDNAAGRSSAVHLDA